MATLLNRGRRIGGWTARDLLYVARNTPVVGFGSDGIGVDRCLAKCVIARHRGPGACRLAQAVRWGVRGWTKKTERLRGSPG